MSDRRVAESRRARTPSAIRKNEAPLNAELFSVAQLERHAQTLAGWHQVGDARADRDDQLLRRLADNEAALIEAYALLTDAVTRGRQLTPAAEWFVDNYHLLEEQVRLARRHLPRGYSRELPRLINAPATGTAQVPRVYDLALQLVSHTHGRLDIDALGAFIAAYQATQPLVLGELWAIPIMLRLALLENLRRVITGVTAGRRDRERAAAWAERMIDTASTAPANMVRVLAALLDEDLPLSNAFVAELASRLQGQGPSLALAIAWLDHRLVERGQTLAHVFHLAAQSQAEDQVAVGNSIGSLRLLGATDWRDVVESMSVVERALRGDPAQVYAAMDFATRDRYRHVVEALARTSPRSQLEVAQAAVELAAAGTGRLAHVGYFLVGDGRPALAAKVAVRTSSRAQLRAGARAAALPLYLGAIGSLTAILALLLVPWTATLQLGRVATVSWWILVVLALCHLAVAVVNGAATMLVGPRPLPRLDFHAGIPSTLRTAVVVPTMLTDDATIDALVEQLEVRYLANPDPALCFVLLTDLRDAPRETMPLDASLVARAEAGITVLRRKYATSAGDGAFYLCHRPRVFNASDDVWMGWERKRGKLLDFSGLVRGELGRFELVVGEVASLQGVVFVIVLDSDTDLPRDAAHQLVGTLAHPLNRAVLAPAGGRITSGYAILQPRLGITIPSANRSRYARLFAGEPGIDPYTRAVADMYQDVFGEGSFVGKGIYDVDAMRASCDGRFPDNRVLSHDLLEGAYGRAGLVSDVLLFEDFPPVHAADVSRRARWIRGDWQIARWLWRTVPGGAKAAIANPISRLSQWKIVDNLRRSLVPTTLVALLGFGWATAGAALLATVTVIATLLLPSLLVAVTSVARRPDDVSRRQHLNEVTRSVGRQFLREGFVLACLPYDAAVGLTSIGQAVARTVFTGRRLLEWRTAADAERAGRHSVLGCYRVMWIEPVAAIGGALLAMRAAQAAPLAVVLAAPVLVLWLFAPALAWWMSRPTPLDAPVLASADVTFLRALARRTWRFFDVVVTAADNDLPPDNLQEDPPVGIAPRTSPTNIGMGLASNLAAYDLGYLTARDLMQRTSRTFATLERLPRLRGHFYNWYDTRTLEPLRPMYVSAVDSGNLSGCLLVLAIGLRELADHATYRPTLFVGLGDTLDVLAETVPAPRDLDDLRRLLATPPTTAAAAYATLERLTDATAALITRLGPDVDATIVGWVNSLAAQVRHAMLDLAEITPWVAVPTAMHAALREVHLHLDRPRTLAQTATVDDECAALLATAMVAVADDGPALAWVAATRVALTAAAASAALRLHTLGELAQHADTLGDADLELLYDRRRQLLSIGYNAVDHRLDAGYYDLLASEARLVSYLGIADGVLPQAHWFQLGRQLTSAGGCPALLSWSGSMFEYLMPQLLMPSYPGTLLDTTALAVVDRQIAYGRERGVPWGISESGYSTTDAQLNYQYRAFGVPGLGFKRGLGDDLVIAPYASMMAVMVRPAAACANLRRLAADGRLGPLGFYEAIDYTPARMPPGKTSITVRSYMAHHQGMGLLALTSVLADRPMQRRFASAPALRAIDLLLQERVPRLPAIFPHPAEASAVRPVVATATPELRVYNTAATPAPEVNLLSNGNYHVAITNAGGGYSRWRDLAVTRWREDPTRDPWGAFCYLRDVASGAFWSVAHQPTLRPISGYAAIFSEGRAEFRGVTDDIVTHVEISVSPEDDIELRRVSLTNVGRTPRTIELTSYAEVVLTQAAADVAHPAFSNLFVQTELLRDHHAILCTRRPRASGEHPPWLMHQLVVHGAAVGATSFETGRAEFIGRGRTVADPIAMHRPELTGSAGAVLDPIVAIRTTVVIGPDETVRVHLVTGMAETRADAVALVEKYGDRHVAERVFELSWTRSQVLQRQLEATATDLRLFQALASNVLYANPNLRAPSSVQLRNRSGQSGLWAYGISGDVPIVLVRIAEVDNVELVRQMVRAHGYWRLKGLVVDLVIWNEDPSGYRQLLQDQIMEVVATLADTALLDRPGGIFVRRGDQMSEQDSVLMQAVARVIVSDNAGSLAAQLERRPRVDVAAPRFVPRDRARAAAVAAGLLDVSEPGVPAAADARPDLLGFNGLGGFTRDGREYVITTSRSQRTPAPWSNVLANPYFGTVVSESGGAYTFCENAHEYRLTPWNDDPVTDASGEAFYLRDDDDGSVWSPTPLPAGGPKPYTTRHGFGYSVFDYSDGGLTSSLRTFVATDAPIKFMVLTLRNGSGRPRRLTVTGCFELVLGNHPATTRPHVVTEVDLKTNALFGRNPYDSEFAHRVAFLDSSEPIRTVTGDRQEIFGRNGVARNPACMGRAHLTGRVGAGLDPCLAMQVVVELAEGQERDVVFTFGSGRDVDDARHLVHRFRGTGAAQVALASVWATWNRTLSAVHVQTPDPLLNVLANGWLVYQVLACRMYARSGYYQSGGAFGFRDQLQDAMALVHAEPAVLRAHLLRAAEHQFVEGDVQHWWHPPRGRGVRTHITDDYLWLPYAACRYVETLGDTGVLDEQVGYLTGRPVKPDEDSYYDLPARAATTGTLYEHCVRAIQHGLHFGAHGLPLMGSGDWNDGMNLVGAAGIGESVWLGFFLHDVLTTFAPLARRRGDATFAAICDAAAATLRVNLEAHAWDGGWYRRAFFDDGRLLGSSTSPECQLDALPQSWAMMTGLGDRARAQAAIEAVDARLVDRSLGVIKLFDPPFDKSDLDPGYVKGYVPGVRENGGQYTHAAVWTVMAFAAAGDTRRAWELFDLINPVRHGATAASIATYQGEPYVVAADVYTNPQHAGRAGWTWYTGSAGWMYRLITESLLGLHLEVDRLRVTPLVPAEWPPFDVYYRHHDTMHHLHIVPVRAATAGVIRVIVDGVEQPDHLVPLASDHREHSIEITVGALATQA